MKKVIRTIAAVALLFVSTSISAKEPKLITEKSSKSVVFEWDDKMDNTSLSFIDNDGNVIYSDYVEGVEDYVKKFNLETLAIGNYFLIVENSIKEITYSLSVSKNEIVILDTVEEFKPVYRKIDGVVYLNYLNLTKEPVDVVVYDATGRKLFKETFVEEMSVSKIFNFTDAIEGEYSIVLKSDSETFYEAVSVK
ncbi:hypothetical protein JQC67_17435 [Aurantibacter crassamenti]|uniref:hypothetical protein n=1 Tax=Aurantibacter crassamenti TaxID=1837375 RepID=UPI001939A74E|nr:hypothetical protein [Aurantibacter crassamenti]MBM1107942.1 hypothetical protein [Aurantibacter crassamenti]